MELYIFLGWSVYSVNLLNEKIYLEELGRLFSLILWTSNSPFLKNLMLKNLFASQYQYRL